MSIAPEQTPTAKIRVLVADDHVTVREGLAAIIGRQRDMLIVAEAATGRDAVDLWRQQYLDVRPAAGRLL
ncbi:MAG: response regulator, partial [Mesorhizobium sp.]